MHGTRGFTLIELVIVMAVAAILSALAIPSYSDYVLRSRATAATSVLKDLRMRMERRYADDRSYAAAAGNACSVADFVDPDSGFSFACTTPAGAGGQAYSWTATGSGASAGFVYGIDEAGLETTGSLPSGWQGGLTLPVTRFVTKRGG